MFDTIIYNAKVYTVDDNFTEYCGFGIANGKIALLSNNNDELKTQTATLKIDAEGKPIYPGFIDSHCHFYSYGLSLSRVDLVGCRSYQELLGRTETHYKYYPAQWVCGRGWDQNLWDDKQFPNNDLLNNLFPDTPVLLIRIDGHAALANQAALVRGGLTPESHIEGGQVEVKDGKMTGILIDKAIDCVEDFIPPPSLPDQQQAFLQAQDKCFAVGLTTVCEAGLDHGIIKVIDSLHSSKQLDMNVYAMIRPTEENYQEYLYKGVYKTDYLHVNAIKMLADGALGSRGALLIEPYADDPDNYGILTETEDFMRETCIKAYENGYQVNIHTIGDQAAHLVLGIYKDLLKGKNDRRWRIEHCQIIHPDDFSLFQQYSIIPSIQAIHATSDMYWSGQRIGAQRSKFSYAYKTLLEQNGWLCNGSDFPVDSINPLLGFYAAVYRRDLKNYPPEGFYGDQALDRIQALKAMTIWGAKAGFEENEKGSLEIGKFADFVILDNDIMTITETEIPHTKVEQTFIHGKQVYIR